MWVETINNKPYGDKETIKLIIEILAYTVLFVVGGFMAFMLYAATIGLWVWEKKCELKRKYRQFIKSLALNVPTEEISVGTKREIERMMMNASNR